MQSDIGQISLDNCLVYDTQRHAFILIEDDATAAQVISILHGHGAKVISEAEFNHFRLSIEDELMAIIDSKVSKKEAEALIAKIKSPF